MTPQPSPAASDPPPGRATEGRVPKGRVFEPTEEEILALMRPWLAADEDSRAWVSTIHRRGESYAKRQLWQVRQALFGRMRRDLSGSTDPDRIRYLRLPERPLLDAVLRASRALDRPSVPASPPAGPDPDPPTQERRA